MKTPKRYLSLVLAVLLVLSLAAGCSKTGESPADAPPAPAGTQEPEASGARQITDMAGRAVALPEEITSVFSTGSAAAIFLYTLEPDKLLGWNYELNDAEKSMILEQYHDLPNFGTGDAVNYEAVIAADPSIALTAGAINDATRSEADQLAEKLGIPVVVVDSDLLAAPEAYRFLGELLGAEEQAERLAAYAEETFRAIEELNVPEEEKVRVYYGNGEDSLETAPAGSAHGQSLDLVHAVNVADLELGSGARVQISPEQLLAWDPDVIVVNGEPKRNLSGMAAAESILGNPDFASLRAVQAGQVYGTPKTPFGWLDRPPGPNRIAGLRWLAGILYPEYVDFEVEEAVLEFFRLFYHMELSWEDIQ